MSEILFVKNGKKIAMKVVSAKCIKSQGLP